MLKKLATLVIVSALLLTVGGARALASAPPSSDGKADSANTPSGSSPAEKRDARPDKKLKSEIEKLVADAKAGKGMPVPTPQNQPRQSNGLSKGAKIGIGVGVAAAIIIVIVVVASKNSPGRVL